MSFKYFLDMAPEDEVINPSSLTKFRKLHLKDMKLLDMLIAKTVQLALGQNYLGKRDLYSGKETRNPPEETWHWRIFLFSIKFH